MGSREEPLPASQLNRICKLNYKSLENMRFLRKTTSIQNSFVQRTTVKQGEVAEEATREFNDVRMCGY